MQKTKILGGLLRSVRSDKQLSLDLMASKLGVDKNTLGAYEREERLPDFEFLGKFSRLTGHDVGKLLQARMRASQESAAFHSALRAISDATRAVTAFFARRSGVSSLEMSDLQQAAFDQGLDLDALEDRYGQKYPVISAQPVAEQPRPGYVYLPLYEIEAAAGNGSVIGGEHIADLLAFKEEWLRVELNASQRDVVLLFVHGRSMEPDLHSGDVIMIDIRDKSAEREATYVIRMDGALVVKEVQRLPGGRVKVLSKNAGYDSWEFNIAELNNPAEAKRDIAIIGRVVWACRRF